MWLLLIFCASTVVAQTSENCAESGTGFYLWPAVNVWYIRYPCNVPQTTQRLFCGEESGWGNDEATVVCREQGFHYGTGRIILVRLNEVGYSSVHCDGTESTLSDCNIGPLSSQPCEYVAVVSKCSNVPQIYVKDLLHSELSHHLVAEEEGRSIQVCLEVLGALTTPIHITMTTTRSFRPYDRATASSDYVPLNQTVVFEPSSMTMLEKCVEIEIIDDSLTEPWEVFSVVISTTTSAVEIVNPLIDVYIRPNVDHVSSATVSSSSHFISSSSKPDTTSSKPTTSSSASSSSSSHFLFSSSFPTISSFTPTKTVPVINSSPIQILGIRPSSIGFPTQEALAIMTAPSPASSDSPSTTTRRSRTSILALVGGITAAVAIILGLTLALVFISLTLCLKEKNKFTVPVVPPPTPKVAIPPETIAPATKERRLSLTNPTYQPNVTKQVNEEDLSPETPEHDFNNPLYDGNERITNYCSTGPHDAVYEFVP